MERPLLSSQIFTNIHNMRRSENKQAKRRELNKKKFKMKPIFNGIFSKWLHAILLCCQLKQTRRTMKMKMSGKKRERFVRFFLLLIHCDIWCLIVQMMGTKHAQPRYKAFRNNNNNILFCLRLQLIIMYSHWARCEFNLSAVVLLMSFIIMIAAFAFALRHDPKRTQNENYIFLNYAEVLSSTSKIHIFRGGFCRLNWLFCLILIFSFCFYYPIKQKFIFKSSFFYSKKFYKCTSIED